MMFEISWKTVVGIAGIAVAGYFAYRAYTKAEEEKKKVEEHKKDVLGDRDLDKEIVENTSQLDDTATVVRVLRDRVDSVKNAKTIEDFDNALSKYDTIRKSICGENLREAEAVLILEKDRLEEAKEKERRTLNATRELARNNAERDKARIIANAIKNASQYAFSESKYGRDRAIRQTMDDLSKITFSFE